MTNQKVILLRGLIASGKSTIARKLVGEGYKRVNKDDLRAMIDGKNWRRENEMFIKYAEIDIAKRYLKEGFNVVVDDTNFGYEEMWKKIADEYKAEFEIMDVSAPFTECILRDASRGEDAIGHKNITRMYEKYVKPQPIPFNKDIPPCYIFDIDGTLAKTNGRSVYDYTQVATDVPNVDVVVIQKILRTTDAKIFIMSGRDSVCRAETLKWLEDNLIQHDGLYMRAEGDDRKDSIIKKELYDANIKDKYNVLGVFDDRNQIVDMWRSLGITVYQVGYGYF